MQVTKEEALKWLNDNFAYGKIVGLGFISDVLPPRYIMDHARPRIIDPSGSDPHTGYDLCNSLGYSLIGQSFLFLHFLNTKSCCRGDAIPGLDVTIATIQYCGRRD